MADMKNNMGNCTSTSIGCEAEKCKYNHNLRCVADHIDVKGYDAKSSSETACATFIEASKSK